MNVIDWIIAHFLQIVGYLLAIILIPRILLERRHPGATIAWLLAIGLVPFFGVPLYFLIGGRRVKKISKKKGLRSPDQVMPTQFPSGRRLSPANAKIAFLLSKAGACQPVAPNTVAIIDDGVAAYDTIMDLLESATESIEIATFILGRDEVGRTLVDLLARKARQGVAVRLLLDALGCLGVRGEFVQPLRKSGGRIGVFLPLLPLRRRWSANLRNHRKMVIIDGRQAIVGGMNLAKEYMGPAPFEKRWKDVAMVISGSGAEHVRAVFQQDWIFSTGKAFDVTAVGRPGSCQTSNGSILQIVGDGPDLEARPLYTGVLAALNQAQESIWVVTPYFVPDEPLSAALALAARMGCDVRLIMPQRSNHILVDFAGRSFLPDLMAAGVRLLYYQPGMLHAKLISIDRRLAVVGTANMDVRSFQLNFEIATFLYDPQDVAKVIEVIESIRAESKQIDEKQIVQKSRTRIFAEDICRVFSPLL